MTLVVLVVETSTTTTTTTSNTSKNTNTNTKNTSTSTTNRKKFETEKQIHAALSKTTNNTTTSVLFADPILNIKKLLFTITSWSQKTMRLVNISKFINFRLPH